MIKVFTSDCDPDTAGNDLTKQFETWTGNSPRPIEITNIHSNSNKFGWMLVIQYKYVDIT